jgi:two-component system sensor kinase FixL
VPPVAGNAVQLQQVLLNLVMNAFEAADLPGASARRVIVSTEVEGDRTVRIGVRDFGPGLPPNGAQPLFEPFHTTKPDGMGMGLAIVRTIVEAHGGTIGASTMDDGGACFFLRLPAAALAQP